MKRILYVIASVLFYICCFSAETFAPVSYTHLDVYKRQAEHRGQSWIWLDRQIRKSVRNSLTGMPPIPSGTVLPSTGSLKRTASTKQKSFTTTKRPSGKRFMIPFPKPFTSGKRLR